MGQKRHSARSANGLFPLHDMGMVSMPSSGSGVGSSSGAGEAVSSAPEQNIHMMSALLLQLVQSIFRFEPKSFLVMLGRELQSVEAAAASTSGERDPASQQQHSGGNTCKNIFIYLILDFLCSHYSVFFDTLP